MTVTADARVKQGVIEVELFWASDVPEDLIKLHAYAFVRSL